MPVSFLGYLDWERNELVAQVLFHNGGLLHYITRTIDDKPRIILQVSEEGISEAQNLLKRRFHNVRVINTPDNQDTYDRELFESLVAAGPEYQIIREMDMLSWDRELVKMALGVSGLVLGQDFILSKDAKLLRDFLFEENAEKRAAINLRGQVGVGGLTQNGLLNLGHDKHVFALIAINNGLAFYANLFGEHDNVILVSSDYDASKALGEMGLYWVIELPEKRVSGPLMLSEFLSKFMETDKP